MKRHEPDISVPDLIKHRAEALFAWRRSAFASEAKKGLQVAALLHNIEQMRCYQEGGAWIVEDPAFVSVFGTRASLLAIGVCAEADFPRGKKRVVRSGDHGHTSIKGDTDWKLERYARGVVELTLTCGASQGGKALDWIRWRRQAVAATRPLIPFIRDLENFDLTLLAVLRNGTHTQLMSEVMALYSTDPD